MVCFDTSRTNYGRIRFLQCIVAILFIILGITIFYRQYLEFHTYNQLNEKQCLRRILYPGIRGEIYDRNGHLLATHRDSFCLYIDLNYFRKNFEQFRKKHKNIDAQREQLWALVHDKLLSYAQQVGPIPFHVSSKKLLQHYQQNILLPLRLAQDLPQELYAKLLNLLPNNGPFSVNIEKIRYYPYGSSACHVIGYVSKNPELNAENLPGHDLRTFFVPQEKGRNGIEAYYNDQLSGHNGGEIWQVTPSGQEQKKLISIPYIQGEDIQISLDIELQKVCEKALGNYKGSVSVLDVNTGEVLAMVSKPDFDLNRLNPHISKETFKEINDSGAWLNRAIQGLYQPGSTFKLVSFSALLRENLITENSAYNCTGSYKIGTRIFRCHKHNGHGHISTTTALQQSCNTFVFNYGLQLSAQKLYQEACFYYLNTPTGIDLPYETQKICIPSPQWKKQRVGESWTTGNTANMLIGQEYLLLTPLKLACFAAALSKNKNIYVPHFVKADPWNTSQALPESAWNILVKGMAKAGQSYIKNIPSAVKSGTAQVKIANEDKYKHIGWIIGFAPVKNPQVAFCVEVEQNDIGNNFWGGQTCAPIAQKLLNYYFKK